MVGLYPIKEAYKRLKPVNKQEEETFVSDEETKKSISNIFISISMMFFALILGSIFFWAYRKERSLMIVALAIVTFLYALMIVILTLLQRKTIENNYFLVYMGSSMFMIIVMIILVIIFSFVASRRLNKEYLGKETQDYLSRSTEL